MPHRPQWYVIQSKPRQEHVAKEQLERQGYLIYLPMLKTRKRLRGKWSAAVEPLFPRYLFVQLTQYEDDFGPLRSTIGVSQVVRFGNQPAVLPNTTMTEIRSRECEDTGYVESGSMEFTEGQSMEIVNGPLSGVTALFKAKKGEERVILLLNMLGQQTRVVVPKDHVVPAA